MFCKYNLVIKSRKSEDGSQKTDVRRRKSEDGSIMNWSSGFSWSLCCRSSLFLLFAPLEVKNKKFKQALTDIKKISISRRGLIIAPVSLKINTRHGVNLLYPSYIANIFLTKSVGEQKLYNIPVVLQTPPI